MDTVGLSKGELIRAGKTFRIRTQRQGGVHINNVIPAANPVHALVRPRRPGCLPGCKRTIQY